MKLQKIDIQEFMATEVKFNEKMYITSDCVFGEGIWDFSVASKERRSLTIASKLRFEWNAMEKVVGNDFVHELKVMTYFLLFVPEVFKRTPTKNREFKVNTIQAEIKKLCKVVEEILCLQQNEAGIQSIVSTSCFGELSLKDFEKIPIHSSRIKEIKRYLKYLANPFIQQYLIRPVKWNEADVKALHILNLPKDTAKENATTCIEDALYMELIKQVTVDVVSFKKKMNLKINSKLTPNMLSEINEQKSTYDVASAFEDYIQIRQQEKEYSLKNGARNVNTTTQRARFKKQYGVPVKILYDEIVTVHRAAIMAILLFTGVRYSELSSFKSGCITKRNNVYVLKGTVIKHRSDLLPTGDDEWVAIPIVRDAVEVLEQFQRFTFNTYIVSPLRSVYLKQKEEPMSLNAISVTLNLYIETSQEKNSVFRKYANQPKHKVTVHRLRHTLARQLIRGRLGLPYISYHLKHINSAVVAYNRTSNVTLGYGGISKEILNSAKQYGAAKKELIQEIYHPNAIVAGGKNANEFMKRKKEYFQGLMVDDAEIDDIITELKNQSLPFLDVGLGFCGGRKDIVLEDGTKQPPPCIGQLKCNPVDCGNAVIPKSKMPIWKKVHQDTVSKLADDQFNYMELELREILKRAEHVINHFQPGREN